MPGHSRLKDGVLSHTYVPGIHDSALVMAGHSRPKDGVLSPAYVPAIHVFAVARRQDVDARRKAGHDG
ncbi:MAG: hypothetical protein WBV52_19180 [Pseudolabrys sp.]